MYICSSMWPEKEGEQGRRNAAQDAEEDNNSTNNSSNYTG